MKNNIAVIVAAGRGSRISDFGGPKQYRQLSDKSVLQHTIECFTAHDAIDAVQVVIHQDDHDIYSNAVTAHTKLLPPVTGGKTRQASCRAGINALTPHACRNVLIHDAARPFLSADVISNVLSGISDNTCALPAIAVADTIKRADQNQLVEETVNRENLHLAQTPQGFMWKEIHAAHADAAANSDTEFTDDAAVAEWAGMKTRLVEGDRNNFKITTLQDLEAARERVQMGTPQMDVRIGSGYDVHTLGPGDGVILCGVKIPHSKALQGHSDADVGLHALTDALLGTLGAGDIGSHFPPSDEKWKNASSDQFLTHAVNLVSAAHGKITNLDVTIVCEAPKIGPHRDRMRQRVSQIANIEIKRVSVKATTNERIGFIGREEGIAALATASVQYSIVHGEPSV